MTIYPSGALCQQFKSQIHRMLEVGRDVCVSSSPTLPLKQGHPEQAAQDRAQVGLEYLQRRRIHSLPGQPSPSEGRSSSSCSDRTSSASVCARCPLSCRWAPSHHIAAEETHCNFANNLMNNLIHLNMTVYRKQILQKRIWL